MTSGSVSPQYGAPSGWNGLQILRVVANTVSKKSRAADKGWWARCLQLLAVKKLYHVTEHFTRPETWTDP